MVMMNCWFEMADLGAAELPYCDFPKSQKVNQMAEAAIHNDTTTRRCYLKEQQTNKNYFMWTIALERLGKN